MVSDLHAKKSGHYLQAFRNKRIMMVLYRSPVYKAVQVNNEDKYQTDD